jgi:protein required for attachment to host cells
MQNNSFWLVVANAGKATVYRGAGPQGKLEKFYELENEAARMQNQDLETDDPGRVKSPTGRRAKRGDSDPKGQAKKEFAAAVADYLQRGREQNKVSKLSIVAPPKFLGRLRQHLGAETEKIVLETVAKNLVDQDVEAAQEHLETLN